MPEPERVYEIVVHATDLDDAAIEALFIRIADAAHADDEQVVCSGRYRLATEIEEAEPRGETVTEWNVLDRGEPYLQPWTEYEEEARSYSGVHRSLVRRERTTYPVKVTEWKEA